MLAALSVWAGSAFAQWQWIDEDGRKVFSDLPPPAHIAPHNVLKRPAGAVPVAMPTGAVSSASSPQPEIPQAVGDKESREAKEVEQAAKKLAQEEEAARRKAQEERAKQEAQKLAQQRRSNCNQAQTALATLQSGRLLSTVSSKGEQGFLSEQERQQQTQRAQAVIKSDCGAAR